MAHPVLRPGALALPLLSASALAPAPALAGEDATGWVGGAVSVVGGGGPGGASLGMQTELDARAEFGPVYLRLDADLHVDVLSDSPIVTPYPPEWAMIQIGKDPFHVRLGVLNPAMGYEDWDEWVNPLPTASQWFGAATPGRLLGGEAAVTLLEGGLEISGFGGFDLDWGGYDLAEGAPSFGATVSGGPDQFGTWSGFAAMPTLGLYAGYAAFEFYPHEVLSFVVDGGGGYFQGSGFAGGELVVNLFPDSVATGVARLEGIFDPARNLTDGYATAAGSLGVHANPLPFLRIAVEGKVALQDGKLVPGVFGALSLYRPEPSPFTAFEEDEAEEEAEEEPAAAPEPPAQEPEPGPQPAPQPAPEPAPEPGPEPTPGPTPEPSPEPAPQPQ